MIFPLYRRKKESTSSSVKQLETQDENIAVAAQARNSAKSQNAPKAYFCRHWRPGDRTRYSHYIKGNQP